MIKLIIFDMDGLMFDTERITMQAYVDVARAWGLPATEAQFAEIIGKDGEAIRRKYRRDFGEDLDAEGLYREIGEVRAARMLEEVPVKEGLFEILAFLKSREIPMAVASGSEPESIRRFLDKAGVSDYFCHILSSTQVERGKPAPDIFLALCDRLGTSPGQTLVLEDSPNGIQAAIAAKIPVIAVPDILDIPAPLKNRCLAVVGNLFGAIPVIDHILALQDRNEIKGDTSH